MPLLAGSHVMVLGESSEATRRLIEAAAAMSGQDVILETSIDSATWPEVAAERPTAILVDLNSRKARRVTAAVRSRLDLAAVPIIGVADEVTDLVFEEALSAGMDDCCSHQVGALGRMLRAVSVSLPTPVARRPHGVVVADPDRDMRTLIGRVFHNAGYDVSFAIDGADALRRAQDDTVQAVVCAAALDAERADAEPLSVRARRNGSSAVWILNTPPTDIPATLARIDATEDRKLAVHDAYSAPDNLLFVTNELIGRPGQEARRSERVLFGTVVRFRTAGQRDERAGYSYNISAGGLYVRTLTPPERNTVVWLELCPPRSDRLVHLEAGVVWCRRPGPSGQATVPSGFGVCITAATAANARRYQEGYEAFLAERVARRMTARPPCTA